MGAMGFLASSSSTICSPPTAKLITFLHELLMIEFTRFVLARRRREVGEGARRI